MPKLKVWPKNKLRIRFLRIKYSHNRYFTRKKNQNIFDLTGFVLSINMAERIKHRQTDNCCQLFFLIISFVCNNINKARKFNFFKAFVEIHDIFLLYIHPVYIIMKLIKNSYKPKALKPRFLDHGPKPRWTMGNFDFFLLQNRALR